MLYRLFLNDVARRSAISISDDEPEEAVPDDMALQLDMQRALAALSPEHRAVIVLVGLEQFSYKEAAEILNLPLGTIMSRLARARQQLRELLAGKPASTAADSPAAAAHLTRIK